jgi:hypothetical protein
MTEATLSAGLVMLERAGAEALDAPGPEEAIHALARGCCETLGDREAHLRPGALKPGERQYFVAGAFFVTPDRRHHMLVGSLGFPPEQRRLMVPIDGGHPGWVHANRSKLLLEDTDEHGTFRQYLRTSRMGSTIFAPITWRGEFHGQLIMAAQARRTMRAVDLAVLVAAAHIAAGCWIAAGGPAWLAANADPPDAFRVDREGLGAAG